MKILFVNPNITESITEIMASEARRSASPDTEIVPVTAQFGTLYIENRVEAAIAGHAVLEALAKHRADCDAAIVSAFGDPGLGAAKELMDIPVVGIAEAALLIAYTLGRRYSIVCPTKRLRTWYIECAALHGLDGRMASARALDQPIEDISRAKDDLADHFIEQCNLAVDQDDAEVVILGGGPIAGLARQIAAEVPVPLVDGVSAAVRLAETLVALDFRPPSRGSFALPKSKPAQNLSPALSAMIDRD